MADLSGLFNLIESATTVHGIAEPPVRGDYPTQQRYDRAYREWESRTLRSYRKRHDG